MDKKNSGGGGIGFVGLLTIVFITLKLTRVIAWSWWWVLSPLWISVAVVALIGITPAFAYAGYTVVRSADANGGLVKAFAKADEVLRYMAEYQEKEAATQ